MSMHGDIWSTITWWLGIGAKGNELSIAQVTIRAFLMYLAALALVRLGNKRFLGRNSAFDFILGIILGSLASRAITGSAHFLPTLVASLLLIALHWALAFGSYYSDAIGMLVKGRYHPLGKDGRLDTAKMKRDYITEHDVIEAMRT
jgi:uncharacterized membrane protein YcaP (DUF421 family)